MTIVKYSLKNDDIHIKGNLEAEFKNHNYFHQKLDSVK